MEKVLDQIGGIWKDGLAPIKARETDTMRSFAFVAIVISALCGYLAWTILSLDPAAYNADQRTILQLMFSIVACMTIAGPILAYVALLDYAAARKRRVSLRSLRNHRRCPR